MRRRQPSDALSADPQPLEAALSTEKVHTETPVVTEVPVETPPKEPVSLSAPLTSLNPRDQPEVKTTSLAAPRRGLELRVSLDYHGVLDCDVAKGPSAKGITTSNREAICSFLATSHYNQVGVCSYIGRFGQKSQQRRQSLECEIRALNNYLRCQGIPESRLVKLCITSQQVKPEVHKDCCSVHVDDKISVLQACQERQVVPVLFTTCASDQFATASTLSDALLRVLRLGCPRAYSVEFYQRA